MVILIIMDYKTEESCGTNKTRPTPILRPIFSNKPKTILPSFGESKINVEVVRYR